MKLQYGAIELSIRADIIIPFDYSKHLKAQEKQNIDQKNLIFKNHRNATTIAKSFLKVQLLIAARLYIYKHHFNKY